MPPPFAPPGLAVPRWQPSLNAAVVWAAHARPSCGFALAAQQEALIPGLATPTCLRAQNWGGGSRGPFSSFPQ